MEQYLVVFIAGTILGGGLGLWGSAAVKDEVAKLHTKVDAIVVAVRAKV